VTAGPSALAFDASALPGADATTEALHRIAGLDVRLRIRGSALAGALLPALAHLRVDDADIAPDLAVSLWDQSIAGAGAPPDPAGDEAVATRLQDSADGRRAVRVGPAGVLWLDLDARSLAGFFRSAAAVAPTDRAKPLSRPLAFWLRDHGRQVVHAAMVARGDAGVLIAGRGGSGKSTVALAAGLAGLAYIGDDLVAIEETGPAGFVGHSLYASGFLAREHLERFPAIPASARGVRDPSRDKIVLQLGPALPGGTRRAAPVRLLLLPRVTEAPAGALRPASAADGFRALGPSSLFVHPGQGQADVDRLARLVRSAPCWWLDLGREVTEIPALVTRALELAGA
jgi:hypothetical protein